MEAMSEIELVEDLISQVDAWTYTDCLSYLESNEMLTLADIQNICKEVMKSELSSTNRGGLEEKFMEMYGINLF
jgi:hypothetical protein